MLNAADGPTVFKDELLYRINALAIFNGKQYANAHYPPLYPLALSPAFLFQDWYRAMHVLNAFWSSLLVPATWFLGRTVGLRRPVLAGLLVAAIPFQAVYFRLLMSENMFLPFFVLSLAMALRGGKAGEIEALLFGFVLGCTHLLRYLFLPAVPVLLCAWFFLLASRFSIKGRKDVYCLLRMAFLALSSYLLIMSIWISYGYTSGFNLAEMLGLHISKFGYSDFEKTSFLFWIIAYTSYIILMLPYFWVIFCFWISSFFENKRNFQISRMGMCSPLTIAALLGGYWIISIRHSYGSRYNHPVPLYIIGRYLMHILPVLIVFYVRLLEKIEKNIQSRIYIIQYKGIFFVISLLILSNLILFHDFFIDVPPWFATIFFNAIDVFNYENLYFFSVSMLAAILPILLYYFKIFDSRLPIFISVFLFMIGFFLASDKISKFDHICHAREIFSAALPSIKSREQVRIVVDDRIISNETLAYGVRFWNRYDYDYDLNLFTDINEDVRDATSPIFFLTTGHFRMKAVRVYEGFGKRFHVYRIDGVDLAHLRPEIQSISPDAIAVGSSFNNQSSGTSAIGLRASSVSARAFLKFGDNTLPLVHGPGGFVSVEVPADYLGEANVLDVSIVDPLTGLQSNIKKFYIFHQ
jgi:hypothetical protein